jgi:hypothetical protein
MNHYIITHDIATKQPLTEQQQYDIMMAIGDLLDNYPLEFEDWKTNRRTEQREL